MANQPFNPTVPDLQCSFITHGQNKRNGTKSMNLRFADRHQATKCEEIWHKHLAIYKMSSLLTHHPHIQGNKLF